MTNSTSSPMRSQALTSSAYAVKSYCLGLSSTNPHHRSHMTPWTPASLSLTSLLSRLVMRHLWRSSGSMTESLTCCLSSLCRDFASSASLFLFSLFRCLISALLLRCSLRCGLQDPSSSAERGGEGALSPFSSSSAIPSVRLLVCRTGCGAAERCPVRNPKMPVTDDLPASFWASRCSTSCRQISGRTTISKSPSFAFLNHVSLVPSPWCTKQMNLSLRGAMWSGTVSTTCAPPSPSRTNFVCTECFL
mmetsp:Transcript_38556/g.89917  ORF Transcript_38556/g.89917 Transcript_38556/m.89917 type:complete len:248 (-) Transcript_38556:666-1409(-)